MQQRQQGAMDSEAEDETSDKKKSPLPEQQTGPSGESAQRAESEQVPEPKEGSRDERSAMHHASDPESDCIPS